MKNKAIDIPIILLLCKMSDYEYYLSDEENDCDNDAPNNSANRDSALGLLNRSLYYLRSNLINPAHIYRSSVFYKEESCPCDYCGHGSDEYVLFSCDDRWYVLQHFTGCMTDNEDYNHWGFDNHLDAMQKYVE